MKPITLPLHGIFLAILAVLVVQSSGAAAEPPAPLAAEPPKEAQYRPQEKWMLRTDDTRLTVGVSSDQKLCIYELSDPDGWNWTTVPSVFPLFDRVDVAGAQITLPTPFSSDIIFLQNAATLLAPALAVAADAASAWRPAPKTLLPKFAKDVDPESPLRECLRPQMARGNEKDIAKPLRSQNRDYKRKSPCPTVS